MAKIESDKLIISDLFSKWFRIPEYQRPYVWDRDQVIELLDDIMQAKGSDPESEYFIGSMVLQRVEKTIGSTKFEEFNLLDGQQRLTTLFLITAVVRDLATDDTLIESCTSNIFQKENRFKGIPERLRIVFDIREQVKDFVNEFVKEAKGTSKEVQLKAKVDDKDEDISIRNMSNAILTIRGYLSDMDDEQIEDFFRYLNMNVLMIYVSTQELDDAFRLFTVMNSRGVKLRNSDILKADNLGHITDTETRISFAKKWEETEGYFGEDFDAFLSHIRTILVKQKATVGLLREFNDNIYNPKSFDRSTKTYTKLTPLLKKGTDTFQLVEKYKRHYEILFEGDHFKRTGNYELFNHLQLMQKGFEADFWIAPLLKYYDKFENDQLVAFVKSLENKFASDWLTGVTPTLRIENVNSIIQAIDDAKIPQDILNSNSLSLDEQELMPILEGNIYGKRAAKYVLLKLDLLYLGYNAPFKMPGTISIEHILPQNPASDSKWKINFTDPERDLHTNKLGNLVLISRRKNSSQGNRDFEIKRDRYFTSNIELFSNSVRVLQKFTTWMPSDLTRNQALVTSKMREGFGFPN